MHKFLSRSYSTKILHACLLGKPNTGKSTLLNRLVNEKLSAVSSKSQTTRQNVLGIWNENDTQVVLYDTPGLLSTNVDKKIFEQHDSLNLKALQGIHSKNDSKELVDVILLMIDVTKPISKQVNELIQVIDYYLNHFTENEMNKLKIIPILNKIDLLPEENEVVKEKLLYDWKLKLMETSLFDNVFYISALKRNGLKQLKEYLLQCSKNGKWKYEQETVTNLTIEERLNEFTREHLFKVCNQEIPYQLHVKLLKCNSKIMKLKNEQDETVEDVKCYFVDQAIEVATFGQKKIVMGQLKYVHPRAILDMEKMLMKSEPKVKVYLKYEVVVQSKEKPQ